MRGMVKRTNLFGFVSTFFMFVLRTSEPSPIGSLMIAGHREGRGGSWPLPSKEGTRAEAPGPNRREQALTPTETDSQGAEPCAPPGAPRNLGRLHLSATPGDAPGGFGKAKPERFSKRNPWNS